MFATLRVLHIADNLGELVSSSVITDLIIRADRGEKLSYALE